MSDLPPGYKVSAIPDGGFAQLIGPLLVRENDAGLRFAFRAEHKHANARDVVHGGMLMTFADQVLGLTVQRAVGTLGIATVSLNCDLVAAARPGDFIEGEAVVTRVTRTIVFVKGTIFCGNTVLLTASGLWKRLKP